MAKTLIWALFCGAAISTMVGCHRAPDELLIRRAIEHATTAAERTDASALGDPLADDFDGNGGELDRQQLVDLLRVAHFRGETLHALTGPITVEPHGERYVASFSITLTSGGKLLPAQMGMYKVETAWRKEGSAWRCYSASWTRQL
ncbi:hypothetical protein [Dyella sp. RRB7]|uniref:hypothetical protein n=1 Tax=Dyella sp. RRB7 TaxID=2919502 RepID=UPI001FA967E1|nr:hypothetical protein [Dyella sp. RRB7]